MTQEKQKKLKFIDKIPHKHLEKITVNLVSIFFIISIFLFIFYMIGNFQSFSDKSQLTILHVLNIISFFLIITSIIGIIEYIFFMFSSKNKLKLIFSIIFFLFCCAISIIFILYSSILSEIAQGI